MAKQQGQLRMASVLVDGPLIAAPSPSNLAYHNTHTHTHTITEGNAAEGRGQRAEGRGLCPLHDRVPCSSCQLCWCT